LKYKNNIVFLQKNNQMQSIELNNKENNVFAKNTIEYMLSLGVLEVMPKSDKLTYDEIGKLKEKQDCLIAEERKQKSEMILGFTSEDRKIFDEGITMETVFEHLN
jgi:hypothetical protein